MMKLLLFVALVCFCVLGGSALEIRTLKVLKNDGACNNPSDIAALNASAPNFAQDMADCGASCFAKAACTATCMEKKISISAGCGACLGDMAQCGYKHCASKCMFKPLGKECVDCSNEHCRPALITCAGCDSCIPK